MPLRSHLLGVALCCSILSGANLVCLGQAPTNDDFTNATPIHGSAITFSGTLSNATFEAGEPIYPCSNGTNPPEPGGSVWWTWTATNSTDVIIELLEPTEGNFYAEFSVHAGVTIPSLTHLDCSHLGSPANRYVAFAATTGTTYAIRATKLDLCCQPPPTQVTLRLTAANGPVVLVAPKDRAAEVGTAASFHVIAASTKPLRYQWLFGAAPMAGQTNPIVLLHELQFKDAGAFSVVISNLTGVVTSSVANLSILPHGPVPILTALNTTISNQFHFAVTNQIPGESYSLQSSSNLLQWGGEETLPGEPRYGYDPPGTNYWTFIKYNVNWSANPTSMFSLPLAAKQKFLRILPDLECPNLHRAIGRHQRGRKVIRHPGEARSNCYRDRIGRGALPQVSGLSFRRHDVRRFLQYFRCEYVALMPESGKHTSFAALIVGLPHFTSGAS